MSQALGLTIDGVTYDVAIEYDSIKRSFEIREGDSKGTSVQGRAIRDLIGTFYSYELTVKPLPDNQAAYERLYRVVTNPNIVAHTVTLPFGQSTITFDAFIEKSDDTYTGYYASYHRWDELSLKFEPISAKFEAEPYVAPGRYELIYNGNGGSDQVTKVPPRQTSEDGSFIVSYVEPERNGYMFSGWGTTYYASRPSYYSGEQFYTENQSTTLFAVWSKGYTYSLIMDPNYAGTSPVTYSQQVVAETYRYIIDQHMTPYRAAHKFLRWSSSSTGSGGDSYTVGDGVLLTSSSPSKRLYAIWDRDMSYEYSIVYDGNYVSTNVYNTVYGVPSAQYSKTTTFTLSGSRPFMNGGTFKGWSRSSTGSTVHYQPNQTINISSYMHNKVLTLYAAWESNGFKLSFDPNGGTGTMEPDVFNQDSGTAVWPIKRSLFTRTGYTQIGWADAPSSTIDYRLTDSVVLQAGVWKTIYAVWTNKKYTLYFTGGVIEDEISGMPEENPIYSDTAAIPIPNATPTRTGATFIGWSEHGMPDETLYKYGTPNDTYTCPYEGVHYLMATWQGNYKLYFVANAGTDTVTNMPPQNPLDADIRDFGNLPYETPVRGDGSQYYFMGWDENQYATEATYGHREGQMPYYTAASGQYNSYLYAIWKSKSTTNKFTLIYDANGGDRSLASQTYYSSDSSYTTQVDVLSRPFWSNHTFLGWDTDKNATAPMYEKSVDYEASLPSISLSPNVDTILYAIWSNGNAYTLTYMPNAGSVSVSGMPFPNPKTFPSSVDFSSTIYLSETIPYRSDGYAFKGWTSSGGKDSGMARYQPGDGVYFNDILVGGTFSTDGVVYAVWDIPQATGSATLRYHANRGKIKLNFASQVSETYELPYSDIQSFPYPASVASFDVIWAERDGFKFLGWADSSKATFPTYTSGSTVYLPSNESIKTIYAVWENNTPYTLHYEKNITGVTVNNLPQDESNSIGTFHIPSTPPSIASGDYEFLGYNETGERDGDYYAPGTVIVKYKPDSTDPLERSTTLYCIWSNTSVTDYTLTYDANANGDTVYYMPSPNPVQQRGNKVFDLYNTSLTRDYYLFYGWGRSRSATSDEIITSTTYTIPTGKTSATLYAVWGTFTPQDVTIYYMTPDSANVTGMPANQEVRVTRQRYPATVSSTIPSRNGYRFLGWSTKNTSQDPTATVDYVGGDTIELSTSTFLYAVWEVSAPSGGTAYLAYNSNGANSTIVLNGSSLGQTVYSVEYTDIPSFPHTVKVASYNSITATRTGYTFIGWSDSRTATAATYVAGSDVSLVSNNSTKIIYAVWRRYTLYYRENSGSDTVSNMPTTPTYSPNEVFSIPNVTPRRTGYTFLGWTDNSSGTGTVYKYGTTYNTFRAATLVDYLYAKWQKNPSTTYTLNYDVGSGTVYDKPTTPVTSSISNLVVTSTRPRKPDSTFAGWKTSDSNQVYIYPNIYTFASTNDTLNAIWSPSATADASNKLLVTLEDIKEANTESTWYDNRYLHKGITFSVMVDYNGYVKYVYASGTANGSGSGDTSSYLILPKTMELTEEFPYLEGCPADGSTSTYFCNIYNETTGTNYADVGNQTALPNGTYSWYVIHIMSGTTVDNLCFNPQVMDYTFIPEEL